MKVRNYIFSYSIDRTLVVLFLTMVIVVLFSFILFGIESENLLLELSFAADTIVVWGYVFFWKKTKNFINQYSLFWISLCVFTFGQTILYSAGLENKIDSYMKIYGISLLNEYMLYSIFSSFSILFAGSIVIDSKNREDLIYLHDENALRNVSFALFLISSPFYIIELRQRVGVGLLYGYGATFQVESNPLYGSMSMWFIPSLFALIYVFRKEIWKYFFLFVMVIPVVLNFLIGSRGQPMAIIMGLLFLWNASVKPFRKKDFFCCFIACVLLMFLTNSIAQVRNVGGASLSTEYLNSISFNLIPAFENALGEFGGTMQIWLRLQHIVPDMSNYGFGFSYLAAVLACIPSFFFGGYSFAHDANLSQWITSVEKSSYGLGFSMYGECYYNFGWFGAIFVLFVGLIIFVFLSGKWIPDKIKQYKNVLITIALYFFATEGRGDVYLGVRSILFCIVFPAIFVYMSEKR